MLTYEVNINVLENYQYNFEKFRLNSIFTT